MTTRATVEIAGDLSKFAKTVQRDLDKAIKHVDVDLKPVTDQIEADLKRGIDHSTDALKDIDVAAERVFDEVARSADEHFDKVARDADLTADKVGADFAAAGERTEGSFEEVGDKAKREFDRVERNARDTGTHLGSIFTKAAAVLGTAFATIQVGRFFLDAAQDAEDLGSAIANTEQIIKSTHGAAGLLAQDVREISRQLGVKIGVDSVEVQNASNILLTFRSISAKVFPRVIGLAADLSAVFGQSLAGSATQLGKALQDPIRGVSALARVGVSFSASQKDQIAKLIQQNDLLGAQKVILDELQNEVGGVAVAGADTTDKLKVAFEDLKREAGEALIDFIDKSGPDMIAILQKLEPVLATVGEAIANTLSVALPVIDVFVTELRDNFAALAPAIQPLADALSSLFELLPKILPILVQIGHDVLPPLAAIVGDLVDAVSPLIGLIIDLASKLLTALLPVIEPVAAVLEQITKVVGSALIKVLPPLVSVILEVVQAIVPLVPVVLELVQAFLPLIDPIVQVVLALNPLLVALLPLVDLAAELIVVVVKLIDPILKLATVLLSLLANKAIVPLIELIAKALTFILTPVVKLVPLLDKFGKFFENINWASVGKAIAGAFSDAWDAVSDFFVGIGHWFAELPGRIGDFLSSLPEKIGHAISAAFDFGLKVIGEGIGTWIAAMVTIPRLVVGAIASLPGLIGDFLGFLWDQIGNLVQLGIDGVIFTFTELPAKALGALAAFGRLVRDSFFGTIDNIKHGVSQFVSFVVDTIKSIPSKIGELKDKIISAGADLIKGLFTGLGKAGGFVADLATNIFNAVKGFLNHVIDKINEGIAEIDDKLPFGLPRIPRLATGGLTRDSGLAVLHPNELVLPLEDRRAVDLLAQALNEADVNSRTTNTRNLQAAGDVHVRVFIGNTELTDIVRVEIDESNRDLKSRVGAGTGRRR